MLVNHRPYRQEMEKLGGILKLVTSIEQKPLRILFVHCNLNVGGVETHLLMLLDGLAAGPYEIHLALYRKGGEGLTRVPKSVKIHDLGATATHDFDLRPLPRLRSLVRAAKPDICYGFHSLTHVNTYLACRAQPFSPGVIACIPGYLTLGRLSFLRAPIVRRMNSLCCPTIMIARSVDRVYGHLDNITTIPNAIDVERVLELSREPVEHPWLAQNHPPVIVTACRLIASKGVDILVRAVAQLRKTRDVRLLVLGDGPERSRLELAVRNCGASASIQFLGSQSNPYAFFSRCDVFAFGSGGFGEGLPTVFIEAMVCRLPVVTSEFIGGSYELVENERTALVVPPRDPAAMAAAIARLLDSRDFAEVIIDRACVTATTDFCKQRHVAAHEALIRSIASRRSPN